MGFILITILAALSTPVFSDSPPVLKPGTRLILKFPELPQTLHALHSGKESTPQLYIALPENYSADRKFPLFVFLYGGHGGEGAGPGRGQEIMENRDCIFVNLPLFKKKIDPNEPFKGMLVSTEQDGEVICQAYAAMLKRVYETIPNIDTGRNIIGGMSNGANTIVAIFEKGDPYLMGLFQHLILVEGGFYSIKTYARYQGNGILYLYGDYAGQDDWLGSKMRAELPQIVKKFAEAAAANHLQATGLMMPNTGHDMPARFNAEVKSWVARQLAQ